MKKKKLLEVTLLDNGRAELHLDFDKEDEMECRRLASCILSLMGVSETFADIVCLCGSIFLNKEDDVKELTAKAIKSASKMN